MKNQENSQCANSHIDLTHLKWVAVDQSETSSYPYEYVLPFFYPALSHLLSLLKYCLPTLQIYIVYKSIFSNLKESHVITMLQHC